jgi:hypothetical protein
MKLQDAPDPDYADRKIYSISQTYIHDVAKSQEEENY